MDHNALIKSLIKGVRNDLRTWYRSCNLDARGHLITRFQMSPDQLADLDDYDIAFSAVIIADTCLQGDGDGFLLGIPIIFTVGTQSGSIMRTIDNALYESRRERRSR